MTIKEFKKIIKGYGYIHDRLPTVPFWIAATESTSREICNCCGMVKYTQVRPIVLTYYIIDERYNGIYILQNGLHKVIKPLANIHLTKELAMAEAEIAAKDINKNNIAIFESEKTNNLKGEQQ